MPLMSTLCFLVLHLTIVTGRLVGLKKGEADRAVSLAVFQLTNFMLERHGKQVLNEKISQRISDQGLDPLATIVDEPVLHLYNFTGLSSIVVSSIRAKYIITDGVTYSGLLHVEAAAADPLTASGYVGLRPHHIPLSVQVFGAKFLLPEVEFEVSDVDLVMSSCRILDTAVSFEELAFESDNAGFAEMLNFVIATHYRKHFLGWANDNLKRRVQQDIDHMLPFPLLNWTGKAAREKAEPVHEDPPTREDVSDTTGASDAP